MKKSINDGTAFSGSSSFLYLFCRVLEEASYKEDRCLEGGNDFRGRKGRKKERKKKGKKGEGVKNGHEEAKARNPWMDETMRREEVEDEGDEEKERERGVGGGNEK